MAKVLVSLVDTGSAIDSPDIKISGFETKDVELTEGLKALRKQNLIKFDLPVEPVNEAPKPEEIAPESKPEQTPKEGVKKNG